MPLSSDQMSQSVCLHLLQTSKHPLLLVINILKEEYFAWFGMRCSPLLLLGTLSSDLWACALHVSKTICMPVMWQSCCLFDHVNAQHRGVAQQYLTMAWAEWMAYGTQAKDACNSTQKEGRQKICKVHFVHMTHRWFLSRWASGEAKCLITDGLAKTVIYRALRGERKPNDCQSWRSSPRSSDYHSGTLTIEPLGALCLHKHDHVLHVKVSGPPTVIIIQPNVYSSCVFI